MTQRIAAIIAAVVLVAGCAPGAAPATGSSSAPSPAASVEPSVVADPLVGVWSRTQDCAGQLAAFEAAGIAESHVDWIVGNWVGEGVEPDPDDICAGARPAEVHSHFFTADGGFGSYDADGDQVDDGDYELVTKGTLDFPSHAAEFGHDGTILVDYTLDGDSAAFEVRIPPDCTGPCLDAHAWALSAFFGPTPWSRDAQ